MLETETTTQMKTAMRETETAGASFFNELTLFAEAMLMRRSVLDSTFFDVFLTDTARVVDIFIDHKEAHAFL